MISASGRYWATSMELTWWPDSQSWHGELKFYDDGFANDVPDFDQVSTEGVLRTRYMVKPGLLKDGLSAVIDTLLEDAARLDIELGPYSVPVLNMEAEDTARPEEWKKLLREQAQRIGWRTPYGDGTKGEG